MVDGVTVLRAGTCLAATTTGEKRGSHTMNLNGNLTIRAWELQSGRKIRLRVKGMRSEEDSTVKASSNGPNWSPQKIGFILGLVFIAIAVAGGDGR